MARRISKGTKLAELIESTGLPLYQVCGDVGIAPRTMTYYLKRERPMSVRHIRLLCDYFECEPEDILD